MSRRFAVIMAGGAGTRFWPESRKAQPKQLLDLAAQGRPLLASTIARLEGVVAADDILIVAGQVIGEAVTRASGGVPAGNVLLEPMARNTSACIGWAALHALSRDRDAVLAVLPADHHVIDAHAFRTVIGNALDAADDGRIVTCGIAPTRPDTGYGYLRLGRDLGRGLREVASFAEKPDLETARRYLAEGGHAWNSGMFFFRADRILEEIARHLPDLAKGLERIRTSLGTADEMRVVAEVYPSVPAVSIDYGVMEKTSGIVAVDGDFGWSDVGSWEAAFELSARDASGNAADRDRVILVDSRGCMVRSSTGRVVALVGVDDLVVVDTGDALLVCRRDKSQDVKKVVDEIAKKHWDRLL